MQAKTHFSRKLEKILWAAVDPDLSVIDIGCGNGRLLRSLRKDKKCDVLGIDISQVSINILAFYSIRGICANADELSDINPTDVVILSHTLEHVNDDKALIKKIAKRVRKYVIVAVPNDCMGPEEEPEHLRTYTKESLTALLSPHFPRIEDLSSGVHLILKAYVA